MSEEIKGDIKILVIEDEEDLKSALYNALEGDEFSVLTASNGEKGLEIGKMEKPDLVILDLALPGMQGTEVLQKIREDEDWGKDTKIIVLTALDDMEKVAEVLEKGGDEYLLKSDISLKKIKAKVRSKLGLEVDDREER